MSVSKVKVAVGFLLTVSALGVGVGVSRHAGPGGGHAGAGRVTTPGAGGADGNQRPREDPPASGRYHAGGVRSLRGFEFRGAPRKAGSAEGGHGEPGAAGRESQGTRVRVQEQTTGSLMVGVGVNSDAGLVGSVVLNETTSDRPRPPTSPADLFGGRAFRGAGQEFRIEPVPGTQLQRYSAGWREPSRPDRPSGSGVNPGAGLVRSIVLNERNFDVLRAPPDGPGCASPTKADEPLHPVEFLDAGTVERTASRHDYPVAAGAGLRMPVPVLGPVPMALDFGFPVVRRPEAPEPLFNFWIGLFS